MKKIMYKIENNIINFIDFCKTLNYLKICCRTHVIKLYLFLIKYQNSYFNRQYYWQELARIAKINDQNRANEIIENALNLLCNLGLVICVKNNDFYIIKQVNYKLKEID